MNSEFKMMLNKVVVTYFKVSSKNLSGETEENHRIPQSEYLASEPRLETRTFGIQSAHMFHWSASMLDCFLAYISVMLLSLIFFRRKCHR
jgi:hypothetical protein